MNDKTNNQKSIAKRMNDFVFDVETSEGEKIKISSPGNGKHSNS